MDYSLLPQHNTKLELVQEAKVLSGNIYEPYALKKKTQSGDREQ